MDQDRLASLVLLLKHPLPSSDDFLIGALHSVFDERFDLETDRFVTGEPPAFVWMWDGWWFNLVFHTDSYFCADSECFSECDRSKLATLVSDLDEFKKAVDDSEGWIGISYLDRFRSDPEEVIMPTILRALSAFLIEDLPVAIIDPRIPTIHQINDQITASVKEGDSAFLTSGPA